MFKWCPIRRRGDLDPVVWDGQVKGMGQPKVHVEVTVEQEARLPAPALRRRLVRPNKEAQK